MITIITDSSANLSSALLKQYSITAVSFHYSSGGSESASVSDDLNTSAMKKYYDSLRNGNIVKTSMVNTAAFLNVFEEKLKEGTDIIYVGMSSGISGAYKASQIAAEELKEKYPDRKIAVIDTHAASLGEGMVVIEAAEMNKNGIPFEEIVEKTISYSKSICQYFTVADLKYLKRSGRISGAIALIGTLLNIRPVLKGNEEGQIVSYSKIRGNKQVLDFLADTYSEMCSDFSKTVAIAHSDAADDASYLAEKLREKGHTGEVITEYYEPVTGAHVGPGTVALFFIGKNR